MHGVWEEGGRNYIFCLLTLSERRAGLWLKNVELQCQLFKLGGCRRGGCGRAAEPYEGVDWEAILA